MLALLYQRLYLACIRLTNFVRNSWANFVATSSPGWPAVILAAFALVGPSVTNVDPTQHRRLVSLVRWLIALLLALAIAVLAARLPFAELIASM